MKKRFCSVWLLISTLYSLSLWSQTITAGELESYAGWPRYKAIVNLYATNEYRLFWIGKGAAQAELREALHTAQSLGLNEADYQSSFFQKRPSEGLQTRQDTIDADVCFTDAALHFFTEVRNGSKPPSFAYNGLAYAPDESDAVRHLREAFVTGGSFKKLLASLQPRCAEYAFALAKLRWFQRIVSQKDFNEAKIVSAKVDSTNKPLLQRLYQLGFMDTVNFSVTKAALLQKVKLAQTQFDLLNDGALRSTSLEALNVPLHQRMEELKTALNTLRWLNDLKETGAVLLLNIPSTYFFVYDSGRLVLPSRVIVGKPSTPTPTLTSTITEVILYPYWMVPHKIAVNELLPSIKKNVGFLAMGNFQVLSKQGKVLNPNNIPWRSLSKSNFPYLIRQSTGCDNALGLIKFNFYNPFTVYLHDTPGKILFASARRFYSHGCMRIEKPEELAHRLLGSNRIAIDTLTAKGCIYHQSPVTVKVEKPLPVMVLYSTVWYTAEGELRFYDDVYQRLKPSTAIAYKP